MTMTRLPTYVIPRGMSHKNNMPCHGLILVLIELFCQFFVSYLFGRTVLQSRDMILGLTNPNGGSFLPAVLGEARFNALWYIFVKNALIFLR